MSPDTTPRDEIAAWLASPEVGELVARVEQRLDATTHPCQRCGKPALARPTWTRQHGDRWLCGDCQMGY